MSIALEAFILCGGRSSRFGTDKARILIEQKPLLQRIANQLSSRVASVRAVSREPSMYDDLGVKTLVDRFPGSGPLAGIQRALEEVDKDQWILLVSCDMVDWNDRWLDALLQNIDAKVDVVAFRDKLWQPFPALYHPALLPLITSHLENNQRSVQRLLQDNASRVKSVSPDGLPPMISVNTPEELDAWHRSNSHPKASSTG